MFKYIKVTIQLFLFFIMMNAHADLKKTIRIPQFSNQEVTIWKTIIYPNNNHILKMHWHQYNRIVVALNNGVLKIVNDQGKIHYLKLEKDHAYYLTKDIPGRLHSDENITKAPIKVLVIELKNHPK